MENSLIPGIRLEIKNCRTLLYDTQAEKERIMPILRQARHINTGNINLIESQYNDKISRLQDDIISMGEHLIEFEERTDETA